MVGEGRGVASEEQTVDPRSDDGRARALRFSEAGIETGADFANVMSALMSDLIAGRVTPQVGNAVCNVGGKLLKVVEMQHRYGRTPGAGDIKEIALAAPHRKIA